MPRVAVQREAVEKVEAEEPKAKVDPKVAQIWERRLVNPGQVSAEPIALKDQSQETRWINTAVAGRFHQAVSQLGYTPVRKEELEHDVSLLGFTDMGDGLVRRGEKGQEVLMRIPKRVFAQIQKRKADLVIQGLKKTRQRMAEEASKRYGANAGDFVEGKAEAAGEGIGGLKGVIKDEVEKVPFSERE